MTRRRRPLLLLLVVALPVLAACSGGSSGDGSASTSTGDGATSSGDTTTTEAIPVDTTPLPGPALAGSLDRIIPRPATVTPRAAAFTLRPDTVLVVRDPDAADAAELLRSTVGPATGAELPTRPGAEGHVSIRFERLDPPGTEVAAEGYELVVEDTEIVIRGADHDGYVWAVQTLRQALSPAVEGGERAEGNAVVPGVRIEDAPRYGWRGSMLDITRHWFGPDDVKAYVDQLSLYKVNRLHLHLSDDQGWRIEIRSHPKLTEVGAANEVGGGPGGFLTQDDYRDLVAYAAARGVTIVPEIDVPGHTNAALLSEPELDCSGRALEPYTGTQVGFSSLCTTKERTYEWFDDVIGELAELTPGPWIHLGGDESDATSDADYRRFVARALDIVRSHGKTPVGWDEIGQADLGGDAVVQYWSATTDHTLAAAGQGASVVLSPSAVTYFDMKHTAGGPGNRWAGIISTRTAYDWDPAARVEGLDPGAILGVEAPVWTELITDRATIQQRTLPRIPALAEVGWTAQADRDWDDFARRVARHAARWDALGWAWTRDPVIDWG